MLAVAFILLVSKLIHKPVHVDVTVSCNHETVKVFLQLKTVRCGSLETSTVDNDSVGQNSLEILSQVI